MPKPNYQRDKRQRDLARQRKQEEKRQKKALKGQGAEAPEPGAEVLESAGTGDGAPEGVEPGPLA